MRVLLVEDHGDIVANVCEYLEPLGYKLDCARNGDAGLALAADRKYDAIVLDLTLPGMDGLDVCRRLRRDLHDATPILMLTARRTVEDRIAGFESGADDYIIKPFSLGELDVRLKALFRRSRKNDIR